MTGAMPSFLIMTTGGIVIAFDEADEEINKAISLKTNGYKMKI